MTKNEETFLFVENQVEVRVYGLAEGSYLHENEPSAVTTTNSQLIKRKKEPTLGLNKEVYNRLVIDAERPTNA